MLLSESARSVLMLLDALYLQLTALPSILLPVAARLVGPTCFAARGVHAFLYSSA